MPERIAPFSNNGNFMSSLGLARWRYFQEFGKWPPEVLEENIADSPVDGGFNWLNFLRKLQRQVKEHPATRTFRDSWLINTQGPDWEDHYAIIREYQREERGIFDPYAYKGPKMEMRFDDALIDELLIVFDTIYERTGDGTLAENTMMSVWESVQDSTRFGQPH